MKKSDLKTGMVVEMKFGKYLVLLDIHSSKSDCNGKIIHNVLVSEDGGWMNLDDYSEDLIFEKDHEFTINKIYEIEHYNISDFLVGEHIHPSANLEYNVLWERNPEEIEILKRIEELEDELKIAKMNLKFVARLNSKPD